MSSSVASLLKVVINNFDVLAWPIISLVYPLYASIRAIETKSLTDDRQWLTYWVLYSMITLFELTFFKALEWVPIWPYLKLILTCWLVIPYFKGAAYVYDHFLREIFINPHNVNIWYVPRKNEAFNEPSNVITAAEKYIQEHGTEEFENLVHRTNKSRWSGGGSTTVYDEDYQY